MLIKFQLYHEISAFRLLCVLYQPKWKKMSKIISVGIGGMVGGVRQRFVLKIKHRANNLCTKVFSFNKNKNKKKEYSLVILICRLSTHISNYWHYPNDTQSKSEEKLAAVERWYHNTIYTFSPHNCKQEFGHSWVHEKRAYFFKSKRV